MVKQTAGHPLPWLPELGSPLAELGLLFGIAYLVVEFWEILAKVGQTVALTVRKLRQQHRRRGRRHAGPQPPKHLPADDTSR